MSERDRSSQERGYGDPPRRSPRSGESSPSSGRRYVPDDEEPFDLPPWSGSGPRGSSRGSSADEPAPIPQRREAAGRSDSGRSEPIPRLGDAFDRGGRRRGAEEDDRSSAAVRDPYDRLRRVGNKPRRAVSFDDDADSGYMRDPVDYPDLPPAPRERSRTRRQPTVTTERPSPPRPSPGAALGGALAAASAQTRFLGGVAGIGLLSLVLMSASVAGRVSALPDWIPIHLNAEGTPDRWGTPATLWRVPLMVLMLTLMSAVVAWYLAKRDPFASRFILTSALIIHVMAWIALVNLLW